MGNAGSDTYDVVIIGAGMSGLVCGCYLAKAGMNVVIAEQHYRPGGYCTSFTRKRFVFDAAAHSFGSYREGGNFRTVIRELGLEQMLSIERYDPSDIVVTPDVRISFWADYARTVQELRQAFPHETRIADFFTFLSSPKPIDIAAMRTKTFADLLDHYFTDDRLKSILSFPIFGNGGLPPSMMSAFTGSKIFTEFVIDGGYYPLGGMQELPNALAQQFKAFGGTLLLSCPVTDILVSHGAATGVLLKSGDSLRARYVISNCDVKQTFFKLLRGKGLDQEMVDKLHTMTPSLSMFIIYLGIDDAFDALPRPGSTLWYLPHYDLDLLYATAKNGAEADMTKYLCRVSPNGNTVIAMSNTSCKEQRYWKDNKSILLDRFIEIIEKTTLPDLSAHIVYKEAATPYTLQRYTLNDQGAAYGWESRREQFIDVEFRKPSFLHALYLTGHWTTYAQGLAGVVYLGCDLAKSIIRKEHLLTV